MPKRSAAASHSPTAEGLANAQGEPRRLLSEFRQLQLANDRLLL